jgi:hypothetical protein
MNAPTDSLDPPATRPSLVPPARPSRSPWLILAVLCTTVFIIVVERGPAHVRP